MGLVSNWMGKPWEYQVHSGEAEAKTVASFVGMGRDTISSRQDTRLGPREQNKTRFSNFQFPILALKLSFYLFSCFCFHSCTALWNCLRCNSPTRDPFLSNSNVKTWRKKKISGDLFSLVWTILWRFCLARCSGTRSCTVLNSFHNVHKMR
ncbi:hypothetical protein NL108_016268 [Boleophthalmus pectinirostris]|nr:hypothetical protein NL108_016268 [Boleophthalmus pectinirostris]